MRIRIEFTVDIAPEHMPALRALCQADADSEAADFVRADVAGYAVSYLAANGVPVRNCPEIDGQLADASRYDGI